MDEDVCLKSDILFDCALQDKVLSLSLFIVKIVFTEEMVMTPNYCCGDY